MKRYTLEKINAEEYTLSFIQQERKIYLHSRYHPRQEAENLIRNSPVGRYDFIILLGNGLGYVLDELIKHAPIRKIYVVEKEEELYHHFIKFHPEGGPFFFLVNKSVPEVVDSIIPRFHLLEYKGFLVLEVPGVVRQDREYYEELKKELNIRLEAVINNQLTESRLGIALISSFCRNVKQQGQIRLLKLRKDKSRRQNLIIAAAGVSLGQDIESLRLLQGSHHIFCVDTALKYLVKNGIHPDAVFSMDPQYFSYLHFYQTLIPGLKVFDLFSGALALPGQEPAVLLVTMNFLSQQIFQAQDLIPFQGGSITNLIFQFFRDSFARIIFTGLDLGFINHNMYIPHSYLNPLFLRKNQKQQTLQNWYFDFYMSRAKREVQYGARSYPTTSAMIGYFHWLLQEIKEHPSVYFSKNCLVEHELIRKKDLNEFNPGPVKEDIWDHRIMDRSVIRQRMKQLIQDEDFLKRLTEIVVLSRHLLDWKDLDPQRKEERWMAIRSSLIRKLENLWQP